MKKFTITEQERKRIQNLYEFDNPFKTGPSSYEVAKAVGFTEAKRKKECYEIMIIDTTGYHNIISNICDNGYFDIKNESSSVGSAPTTGKWVIENNTIKITLSDGKTFSGPISDKSLQSQIAQYIVTNFTKFESSYVDDEEKETVKGYISGSQPTTSTEQGGEQTTATEQPSTETTTQKSTNKVSQIQQKVVDAGLGDLLGPKGVDGRFGPYTADAVLQLLNKK
jgi:hypothetical protein